ncbi:hypothetical protein KFU94_29040 [Chloroflexi bacterium TSY]|nr:hypothetical protein [Chloroflexi bacterium TSY]
MQARSRVMNPRILVGFLVALISAFMLSACGGGSTGSTWINYPSIPIRVQSDGTASVFGYGLGAVVPQATVQQLQTANVQRLEVRPGYNGLHIYANGEDLPYLAWDEESMGTLQELVRSLPRELGAADAGTMGQAADALSVLRQIGFGVALDIAPGEGQSALDISSWSGETSVQSEEAGETTIGPIALGSLAFDAEGNGTVEGIPLADLGAPVSMPSAVMNLLSSLGDQLSVKTQPNGIDIAIGDRKLPSLAYDSGSLERLLPIVEQFAGDPATVSMVKDIVPKLTGADLNVAVSLTGEPVLDTSLAEVPVQVNPDGTLSAFGLPLGASPLLQPDMLAQLQSANIQKLDVNVVDDSLQLAVNNQALPVINWSDASLDTFSNNIAPALGLPADQIGGGVGILRKLIDKTPLGAELSIPVADGAAAVDMPAEIDFTMQAPDLGDIPAPILHLDATVQGDQITSVYGLSGEDLRELGVDLPPLPANVMDILKGIGAQQIQIKTTENQLDILADGSSLLSLSYDQGSLQRTIEIIGPLLGEDSPLGNPVVSQFLQEQILPLIPAADVDVKVNLE